MQFENTTTSDNIEKKYHIYRYDKRPIDKYDQTWGYHERFIDEHGNFCYNFRVGINGFGRAFCKDCEKEILQHRQIPVKDLVICQCIENQKHYKEWFW